MMFDRWDDAPFSDPPTQRMPDLAPIINGPIACKRGCSKAPVELRIDETCVPEWWTDGHGTTRIACPECWTWLDE